MVVYIDSQHRKLRSGMRNCIRIHVLQQSHRKETQLCPCLPVLTHSFPAGNTQKEVIHLIKFSFFLFFFAQLIQAGLSLDQRAGKEDIPTALV